MTAVWYRFRAELRSRWRAWLGLALLVGLASGAVMALAAGARRTDTAYERFLDAQNAYDVAILNYPEAETAFFDLDEIAALPMVADSAGAHFEYYTFFAGNLASEDGRIGTEINRFRILEGRRADPEAADEIVVGFALAEEHDVHVGDTVDLIPREYIEFFRSPETVMPPEDLPPEELDGIVAWGRRLLAEIPDGKVHIVGIEASPGEFPPQFVGNRPLVHLTPAAHSLLHDGEHELLMVRLHGGADAVDDFVAELERRSQGRPLDLVVQRDHAAAVERSIHFQAVALWLLAGLTALASALIVGQLLARLTHIESDDDSVLRALGMARGGRVALGVARAALIGAAGAVMGAAGAWVASAAFPTGLAGTAEPSPGMRLDPAVMVVGGVATVAVVVALSVWPAWRVARVRVAPDVQPNRSRFARVLAVGAAPAASVGMRMAVEPGRGRTAVPVRTTLAGVTIGIAALTAAVTFGASLSHLLATPRLYGVTWDLELTFGDSSGIGKTGVEHLRSDDRVSAIALGAASYSETIELQGTRVGVIVFEALEGPIAPPVLEGRSPERSDEIALGPQTLDALDSGIGDRLEVAVPGGQGVADMTVVGTAVLPSAAEDAQLGRGALVTPKGGLALESLAAGDGEVNDDTSESDPGVDPGGAPDAGDGAAEEEFGVLLRLASGADADELIADLARRVGLEADELLPTEGQAPTDIVNFGRVEAMPFVLGGILAAIAAGALAHLLLSAVQRRRRDLAVLKTLGFVRRQVATTVAAQATTVAVLASLVGVPVGVGLGRWVWTLMADNLGVVAQPQVPVAAVVAIAVGAVAAANLVAFVPGQLAARTRPASVLRSE